MLVMALAIVTGLEAQTTSGRLIGTVVDTSDQPLPGVTVVIESEVLIGGPRSTVTEADGSFSFIGLSPGFYRVRAELPGFMIQERAEVKVNLGGATALKIEMAEGKFDEEINVVADSPVVDPTQVNTEQVFTLDYLTHAAVGSNNRSYQSVLSQAAGVTGGGNPNVYGSTLGENAYYVDGAETSDPVTSTFGINFNFDAIQEIQFQTGGFEAEFGRATGGIVNLVTKSGGNQLSGTVDLRYRDQSFLTDGDHFDKDERDEVFEDYGFTLGGPIIRDKLWFFASYEWVNSERTPIYSVTTRDFEGDYYLAKLTWQPAPAWRAVAKYSADPATIYDRNASQWISEEAGYTTEQGGPMYSAELNGVLSESLLWNLTYSNHMIDYSDSPTSGDLETIHHYNYDTGLSTANYYNQQYSDRDQQEILTNLSWFVDDLAGSHELKLGVELTDGFFRSGNCYTGTEGGNVCAAGESGFWYGDLGDPAYPYHMREGISEGFLDFDSKLNTVYVQDSWRPQPNLTLKIGVRYDQSQFQNDVGDEIADLKKVQPRLGFAWDIGGQAKNLLRASWGRFMHPSALTLASSAASRASTAVYWYACSSAAGWWYGVAPEDCQQTMADWGWMWTEDREGWDPYGWFSGGWVYGSSANWIDPNLEPTYADELIIAYERELFNRTSIELTYVDKKTKDIFEDTCNGNFPEPGASSECGYYVFANFDSLKRDYEAWMVKVESRAFEWLYVIGSYTYASSEGNIEYTQNAGYDYDIYPWHFENRYGYLSDHRQHRFKLNGYVRLPLDFVIGFDAFWSSAFRWTPTGDNVDFPEMDYGTYYVEPRGSRKGANAYNVDLQISKGFNIKDLRLELLGVVYNLLSTEYVTGYCSDISGCGSYATGDPTSWSTPRRYEVGFRFEF
jgi:hypothetical protein